MLDRDQRADRYRAQTGRNELTPRQRRRSDHKDGHQSLGAAIAREVKSEARAERRARREAPLAGLLPTR
ncbi:hypothetical protein [Microbispora sp. CA-102843]|uniref:hypothetical protein n=1 Tax=Microbispora sp. CA-102843 TaxID=3239952 RepID=UPI003D8D9733